MAGCGLAKTATLRRMPRHQMTQPVALRQRQHQPSLVARQIGRELELGGRRVGDEGDDLRLDVAAHRRRLRRSHATATDAAAAGAAALAAAAEPHVALELEVRERRPRCREVDGRRHERALRGVGGGGEGAHQCERRGTSPISAWS